MDDCSLKEYYFLSLALCKNCNRTEFGWTWSKRGVKLWRFLDPPAQVLVLIPVPAITHRKPPDCSAVMGTVRHRNPIREPARLAPLAANRPLRRITPAHREPVQPVRLAARHLEIPALRAGHRMSPRRSRDNSCESCRVSQSLASNHKSNNSNWFGL